MASKTRVGTAGGSWSDAGWTPTGAPTASDDVLIAGPAGAAQTITGPGTASSLTLTGNTVLSGGFGFGAVTGGQAAVPGALTIGQGSAVAAGSASVLNGSVLVSGAGAKLTVAGALSLGGGIGGGSLSTTLTAQLGAVVQAGDDRVAGARHAERGHG